MIGSAFATSASRIGRITAGVAFVGLAVAGCGSLPGYGDATGSTNAANRTSSGGSGQGVSLSMSDTDLGTVLVADGERTVYLWKGDDGTKSACEDDCEAAWPPVTTEG